MSEHARYFITCVLIAACMSLGSVAAQSVNGSPSHAADLQQRSLLWSVTAPTGVRSYLFGTIHLPDSSVFVQRDTVLALLDSSEIFVSELNLDSMLSFSVAQRMMLRSNESINDYFSPEQVRTITDLLEKRFGPLMAQTALRMKPGAILAMLVDDLSSSRGGRAPTTIDQFLWNRAKRRSLPRMGVETIDEQLAVMDSIPPDLVIQALEEDGEHLNMDALVEAYCAEDLPRIATIVDSLSQTEQFMEQLNDRRNEIMVSRLAEPLQRQRMFIAIGAAHLPGPQGVLRALQTKGFRVEPVVGGKRRQWLDRRQR